MRRPCRRRRASGFTYLGVIILVAIISLVCAAGLKMGSLLQRNAAEQELLDIGAQFSDALQSYASATPAGQPQQPRSLKDLLKDPRFPYIRRHLRKLFVDPITGKAEWGLTYLSGEVGVVGVYSLSKAAPLKVGNFEARFQTFEGKTHFSDWKFVASGQALVTTALPAPAPGQTGAGQPAPPPADGKPGTPSPGLPPAPAPLQPTPPAPQEEAPPEPPKEPGAEPAPPAETRTQ